ncbi:MAG: TIR domain-containing protein, partial [Candidatus Limnocylindria bacterium]
MLPTVEGVVAPDRDGGAFIRAISLFKDCLTDGETLRTIDNLFIDLGFDFDAGVEQRENERAVGQRRARAAGYLETLDARLPDDRSRIVDAMSTKVTEWGDDPKWEHLARLHRVMKTAGYEWTDTEFLLVSTPTEDSMRAASAPPLAAATEAREHPAPIGPAVFISYAHEDDTVAHALAAALRARDCRVWIDS